MQADLDGLRAWLARFFPLSVFSPRWLSLSISMVILTVTVYYCNNVPVKDGRYSITELAHQVNEWCLGRQVVPLHNRVGPQVTARNIRYYQSLGMLDRPSGPHGFGFTEKHRVQLIAIRLFQAKGLPLEKIQSLLVGKTEEELAELERQGVEQAELVLPSAADSASADWTVTSLDQNFLLLSRSRWGISSMQKQRILEILNPRAKSPSARPEASPDIDEGAFRPEID